MSQQSFFKRRWKLLLNIITLLALAILIYAIRDQLADTIKNLQHVNTWLLLLLLPAQALNYHAQTKLYQDLFAVVGNKLPYRLLYRASLELNFVNHVFPSAGVSGISYFGARMRNPDITGGKATVVQLMKLVLLILSFEILLVAGLLFLALGNKANDFVILVTSSLTTLMVIGTMGFALIIGSKQRISATFTFLTKLINRILHTFRPKHPETISIVRVEHLFEELHGNYKLIESQWRKLKWPFFWALMANITEVLSIYIVYLAFGEAVNIGAIILAYAVANFAGMVSILPGGVGVYEALMTATLVAAGVPAGLSVSVTVMYRVLNTLIQVPPGYLLYHQALRGQKEQGIPPEMQPHA
jgi:uncharacterized protein (TIRG00374 family)